MKLSYYRALGGSITVCSYRALDGSITGSEARTRWMLRRVVASFANSPEGLEAFGLFKNALARDGFSTLYNEDEDRVDVGILAELDPAPALPGV